MPRTGYVGECLFCGKFVYEHEGPAYGVIGWEGSRSAGGANQIMLRTRVDGKVAHTRCVRYASDRQKRGIALDQEVLDFG